ncbi:MAG TPA: GNAT family N-acetyltransferase [Actinomycetota bacterium]
MKSVRVDDVPEWLGVVSPLLLADEARHNLLLGLADTLQRHPGRYPGSHLWVVREGENPVAAAMRTPPFNLLVSGPLDEAAATALLDAVEAVDAPPGVSAALPEVEVLARAWSARHRGGWRVVMTQGIYALRAVNDVPLPPGAARPAGAADRDLLLAWVRAFADEAVAHRPLTDEQVAVSVDQRLMGDRDGFWLWEVGGEPVSVAGFGGPTPNGIRVGPVYTPPTRRGLGYGTAVVAAVSRDLLASGRTFCFLFTDLANPTSNAIYRRIGYEQVCESAEITFDR